MSDRDDQPASQTPDLMDAINRAMAEAEAYQATREKNPIPPEDRDRAVDELIEWLKSDRLDWEAIERAHSSRV